MGRQAGEDLTTEARSLDAERAHEDRWYARAIRESFFDREGFRRLVAWNLAALHRAVPLSASMDVLSLGCGLGDYELALAASVGHIVGIDLSPVAIAEAERRATAAGIRNVEFTEGSIADLSYAAGSFDLVYALGALHHLPAPLRRALVARVHGWLRPSGWFYARDPNARGVLRQAVGAIVQPRGAFHSPTEEDLDPALLVAELTAAGFAGPRIDYTDVLAGPLPWVLGTSSSLLWTLVFAFDRAWLAVPGLRRLASQFSLTARR
jgi:SAM-dependent methyltransferase